MMGEVRTESGGVGWLSWSSAGRAHPSSLASGDLAFVHGDERVVLLALIDGLGHGGEAAEASSVVAGALLRAHEENEAASLTSLFEQAHVAARRTRGAALSVARFVRESSRLEWAGVGNVEGLLLLDGRRERIPLSPGIVGYRSIRVRALSVPLERDAVLALATDGVRAELADDHRLRSMAPDVELARALLETHALERDDGLVLLGHVQELG